MPLRLLHHIKNNAVAYIALFVALTGTSYAAVSLPSNSVGQRQIRNDVITPPKLNGSTIGGYVLYWAHIDTNGRVLDSRPSGARATSWNDNPSLGLLGGPITWHRPIPKECFALATAAQLPVPGASPAYAGVQMVSGPARFANVQVNPSIPVSTSVAVICPVR
jgi:hypothetical protein